MITKKDLEFLGTLSKINYQEDELEKINKVLDYVSKINEVNTEDVGPTHLISQDQSIRQDTIKESLPRQDVLKNTVDHEYGYFKLPRVLD